MKKFGSSILPALAGLMLITSAAFTPGSSATLVGPSNNASGVQGLVVDGLAYDVVLLMAASPMHIRTYPPRYFLITRRWPNMPHSLLPAP
jgi:hypothetical protein